MNGATILTHKHQTHTQKASHGVVIPRVAAPLCVCVCMSSGGNRDMCMRRIDSFRLIRNLVVVARGCLFA